MSVDTGEATGGGVQPVCAGPGGCGVTGHKRSACVMPVCAEFFPDRGGAHRWCRRCGWQSEFHADVGEVWEAIAS